MPNSKSASGAAGVRLLLRRRLEEKAPGRIQLLAGPRQVGKTTILLDLARHFGQRAVYAAADSPEAGIAGFWERFWAGVERTASRGTTVALLDEIHLLPDWAASLKGQWDRIRRLDLPVHIVATGSSALSVTHGSRESLAGRFERLILSHWSAADLAQTFHVDPADAAHHAVLFGTYPGAWPLRADPARWRAYVRDAIIEPAIGRDVLALSQVRKPALLRQVFAVAVGSPAQIVSLQKLQGQLADRGALETIASYLDLLQEAYLVAGLEKFSRRAVRRRAAPRKLISLSNAFLSATDPSGAPDPVRDSERFGAWVENACLASAINRGQRVTYWREEPLEADGVLEGDWGTWVVEIKTARFESRDLGGLLEFSRRHAGFEPLVITRPGDEPLARRLGLKAINWIDFLVAGPPAA